MMESIFFIAILSVLVFHKNILFIIFILEVLFFCLVLIFSLNMSSFLMFLVFLLIVSSAIMVLCIMVFNFRFFMKDNMKIWFF